MLVMVGTSVHVEALDFDDAEAVAKTVGEGVAVGVGVRLDVEPEPRDDVDVEVEGVGTHPVDAFDFDLADAVDLSEHRSRALVEVAGLAPGNPELEGGGDLDVCHVE